MRVYLELLVIIFLVHIFVKHVRFGKKNDKRLVFLILTGCFLVLICALRGPSVGTDTRGYWNDYRYERSVTAFQAIQEWGKSQGYYWLNGIFSRSGIPIQIFFGIIAALYVSSVFYFIYKYSKSPLLSVIMFLSIGTFAFSMAGMKQTTAMILTTFSFELLQRKKNYWFIAVNLIASLFHFSSLIFLILLFVIRLRQRKTIILFYCIFVASLALFGNQLFPILGMFTDTGHYGMYLKADSRYTMTGFMIQLLVVIVCLIYMQGTIKYDCDLMGFYHLVFLGLAFQSLATVSSAMFRMSIYFSNFAIVLFPTCLSMEKNRQLSKLLQVGALAVFSAYFLYSVSNVSSISPYRFFWQAS